MKAKACKVEYIGPWINHGIGDDGEPYITRTQKTYSVDGNETLAFESPAFYDAIKQCKDEHPGIEPTVRFVSDCIFSTPYAGE
jgi:hypothetical protein